MAAINHGGTFYRLDKSSQSGDCGEAYSNLGAVLFNAKMTEEAIDYFKEAIRIRPDYAAAQKNLETALLRSEGLE